MEMNAALYGVSIVSEQQLIRPKAVPLPATVDEMIARRPLSANRTLNDYVDDIHKALWVDADSTYRELLDAVYDEDAVEGSLSIDNAKAAEVIRDYAKDPAHRIPYVASKKLATIVKSLNVVLRRYKMSRKERAGQVAGEQVQPGE
jgi:hypothetical protein